jgi:transcriptional regulator with GAF, ATPase, and Fis domain
VVAATNRDLAREVAEGRFREDLYYRLDVFPILVPPLRDRTPDIAGLAAHFLERATTRLGRPAPRLTQAMVRDLERYDWPGNVRELQNVIERAVITGGPLAVEIGRAPAPMRTPQRHSGETIADAEILNRAQWLELERENLRAALVRCRWKIAGKGGAAELLGMKPNTLRSRMERLEISRPI